ncbi:MAG: hypothetical protein J7K04_13270 [Spirochaetales bacterium]|nr:hypothetical protein [Spirochaetales bacterium]
MFNFDYIKTSTPGFKPKTPSAALKGIEENLFPVEDFIYLGTSVKPINEKPYDIDTLERVLAKHDLDIRTYTILNRIFEELTRSSDQETALFAAESINLIENRYNTKIEDLKEKLEAGEDHKNLLELARTYYEFALLNERKAEIKSFYLRESFRYIKKIISRKKYKKEDILLLVRVLIELRMYDQAFNILKRVKNETDPMILFLKAEVEFHRRRLSEVFQYCIQLTEYGDELDETMKAILAFWVGF